MKILGIGVDIVENLRIKKSIKNKNFINRIFTSSEILLSSKVKDKASYYSKRFAAKEAFSKSIGTGFRNGFNFKDISVMNNKAGKPSFIITNKIKKIVKEQFKISKFNFFLSISDEKKYSIVTLFYKKNENR
tara:strand:+ start:426 stop:821 length:396 start_codon:yes stop_codon:yes gene_type:complete